jgi:uncharacterized membrane protein
VEGRVKLFGHPIHPMLIPFPIGLLATAVVFDAIYYVKDVSAFTWASFYMIAAGIIAALVAAVFGLLDWVSVPSGTRAKSIGLLHGGGNVTVVVLFAIAWLLRLPHPEDSQTLAFILELIGLGLMSVTGWLGGELVDRLGVGVDRGANLDAPSSLSGIPATATSTSSGSIRRTG